MGRFEVEIGDSKNMVGLRIMHRYRIKNKKNSIRLQKRPFKLVHLAIMQVVKKTVALPRILSDNVHDVGGHDGLVILAFLLLAHTQQILEKCS